MLMEGKFNWRITKIIHAASKFPTPAINFENTAKRRMTVDCTQSRMLPYDRQNWAPTLTRGHPGFKCTEFRLGWVSNVLRRWRTVGRRRTPMPVPWADGRPLQHKAFDLDDLTGKYGNVNSLVFPRLKLELTHKHVDTRVVPYLLSSNISNITVFHV